MATKISLECPFDEYIWRWATLTPTENLNKPSIYFGCLKALVNNEGKKPSSEEVFHELQAIQKDLSEELGRVTMARTRERNIFRNSSQYWKMSGLLLDTSHGIKTSDLAKAYVNNEITKFDYASYLIKTLTLPNRFITDDSVVDIWKKHKLEFKPLEELLKIILELSAYNLDQAFISNMELLKLIIPMVGNKYSAKDIAAVLVQFRANKISGADWYLDRAVNEHRCAKEFLIFLRNYEILDEIKKGVFFADESSLTIISTILGASLPTISTPPKADATLSQTFFQKRERKTVSVLSRPQQQKFRKDLLTVQSTCILSGVKAPNVLQARHIIPVKNHGSDSINNGIILRSDLHILYDIGDIKIMEDGSINISDQLAADPYYSKSLPKRISIPTHIDINHIRIRNTYDM
ncbi:HNH endonuclease [Acinetobacter seifertii]|nr:HNH endonuclease [Acinetobacter seifertii]